jgi:hypothetical protein
MEYQAPVGGGGCWGRVGRIDLVRVTDKWRAVVKSVIHFRVMKSAEFLGCLTVGLSEMTSSLQLVSSSDYKTN